MSKRAKPVLADTCPNSAERHEPIHFQTSHGAAKPICPSCGSHLVLYRQKDNTYGCRRCGARWDKSKTKE